MVMAPLVACDAAGLESGREREGFPRRCGRCEGGKGGRWYVEKAWPERFRSSSGGA